MIAHHRSRAPNDAGASGQRHGLGGGDLLAGVVVMAILLLITKVVAMATDALFRVLGL